MSQYRTKLCERELLDGDAVPAIKRALNLAALAGSTCEIVLPHGGDYSLESTLLPIAIPAGLSHVTIRGRGIDRTALTVTGTAPSNVFYTVNQSIDLLDFSLTGNSQASSSGDGDALLFVLSSDAITGIRGPRVCNVRFRNFRGDYWLYVLNMSSEHAIDGVMLRGCAFESCPGNARGPTDVAIPSQCIGFRASFDAESKIRNIVVHRNIADGTYIKTFAGLWSGTERAWLQDNVLKNFGGDAIIASDVGAYALMAYNDGHLSETRPDQIHFDRNEIDGVKSCGVYCADVKRIYVRGNTGGGQTDTADGTLPKGFIALNQPECAEVDGNVASDCQFGLELVGAHGGRYKVRCNDFEQVRANGIGIRITTVANGKGKRLELLDNDVKSDALGVDGVRIDSESAYGWEHIILRGGAIDVTSQCIRQYSADGSAPLIDKVSISGVVLAGANSYAVSWHNCSSTVSEISGLKFLGGFGDNATLLRISLSTRLAVHSNTFFDIGANGYAIESAGAQGSMSNMHFPGVPVDRRIFDSGGDDLGLDDPPAVNGLQGDAMKLEA